MHHIQREVHAWAVGSKTSRDAGFAFVVTLPTGFCDALVDGS